MINLEKFYTTDIGVNALPLYETVSKYQDAILVDLGVRTGTSSEIMLINSERDNNKVFGVDVDWNSVNSTVDNHPNYTKILSDSVTAGKYWERKVSGVFIDTFHIKEQVLAELYYWYPHIAKGGFVAFHDTNWPEGKHDEYGGMKWERVEEAVKAFFNVPTLNYEDRYIKMENYPESWGMTIVQLKQKRNYIKEYKDWDEVFAKRNYLISLFWNESNKGNVELDLVI